MDFPAQFKRIRMLTGNCTKGQDHVHIYKEDQLGFSWRMDVWPNQRCPQPQEKSYSDLPALKFHNHTFYTQAPFMRLLESKASTEQ